MALGTELARLFVRIGADTSELQAGLNQATSATTRFGSQLQSGLTNATTRFGSQIKTLGQDISQVGRGLTAGLTLPIVGLGVVALKASIDFESAFAGVRKTVSATEPEFAQLRQGIRDMAKELPSSAKDIAAVAEAAGQLGVQQGDILDFTKVMVKLGATTNLSATEAATGMARLANIMQVPVKDVGKLADVLVNLGNKGASTEKEILDMGLRIAGAAQQIGMSATDVLAFANALSSVGVEAEAGGSAISRTFIAIAQSVAGLDPTPEQLREVADATSAVTDASDNLGQAQRSVRDAGEGVAEAQRGVRDATEGVDAAQRASRNATEQLRDAYKNLAAAQRDQRQASLDARRETLSVAEAMQGLREVQAQAGSGALEVRSAQLALADAQHRLAEATKKGGLEQQQATLAVQQAQARLQQTIIAGPRYSLDLRNAQLRLEEAQNRVGSSAQQQADKMQQAQRGVRNASEGVADARRGERNANEAVDASNRGLRNSQEGVTAAQQGAAKASRDLESAQQKLNDLTDAGSAKLRLFAEVSGMSVEEFSKLFKSDPSKAITAFVEGLGKMKAAGQNVFNVLDKLGLSEVRQRDALLRLAGGGDILRKSLEEAATSAGSLDKEFEQRSQTAAAQLAIKWNQITDSMITLGDTLRPIMMSLLDAAQPFFDLIDAGAKIFANLPKPVQIAIVAFAGLLAVIGPLLMIIGSIASGVGAIIAVMGFLGISFAGGSIAVTGLALSFGTLMIAALPWIALAAALALAGYLIYKNWDKIKDLFNGAKDAILSAGQSVLDFFSSNWPEIATLISGPFAPLVALATDAFGIRSALQGALGDLIGWIGDHVPSGIRDAFGDVGGLLVSVGEDIIKGLWKGMKSVWKDAKDWLGGLTDIIPKIKGPPSTDATLLEPAGEAIMGGLLDGMEVGWADIEKFLGGVSSDISKAIVTPNGAGKDLFFGVLEAFKKGLPVAAEWVAAYKKIQTNADLTGRSTKQMATSIQAALASLGPAINALKAAIVNLTVSISTSLKRDLDIKTPVEKELKDTKKAADKDSKAVVKTINDNFKDIKPPKIAPNTGGGGNAVPQGPFNPNAKLDPTQISDHTGPLWKGPKPTVGGGGFGGMVDDIRTAFSDAVAAVGEGAANLAAAFSDNFNAEVFGQAFGFVAFLPVTIIRTFVEGLIAGLPYIVTFFSTTLPGAIAGAFNFATGAIELIGNQIVNGIVAGLNFGVGLLTAWPGAAISALITAWQGAGPAIEAVGNWIVARIVAGLGFGAALLTGWVTSAVGAISDAYHAAGPAIEGVGNWVVQQIGAGINGAAGWLWEQITSFGSGFAQQMNKALSFDASGAIESGLRSAWNVVSRFFNALKGISVQIHTSHGIPTGFGVTLPSFAQGTPYVPEDMLAFIHRGEMVVPRGVADQMREGASGANSAGASASGGGLNIEVNGPVRVVNTSRGQDVNGAMGDLAFGIKGQLNRRGVYT